MVLVFLDESQEYFLLGLCEEHPALKLFFSSETETFF